VTGRTRLGGERIVLGDAIFDQAREAARDLYVALWPRMSPVAPQEERNLRQRREVIAGVD
jgi:hypothetical protein